MRFPGAGAQRIGSQRAGIFVYDLNVSRKSALAIKKTPDPFISFFYFLFISSDVKVRRVSYPTIGRFSRLLSRRSMSL